ncbi:MAG: flagellar brake protein [Burkholderiaceae bacterium]|nr:flagellar brake protein [Burkholderiaceae bacterium]
MSTDTTDLPPAARSERKIPFAALQARVGEHLQLLVPRYAQGKAFTSSLVGWIESEFLIVRRVVDNGAPVPLVMGDTVTVRLFTGTDVAEFASTVQRVFGASFPYLHLDYPAAVRALTLRAEPRVSVDLPAVATIEGREGDLAVRLRDISSRGARMQAPSSPGGPGTRMTLRVSAGEGEDAPSAMFAAEVRSVRPMSADAPDGPCACGLKFDHLTDEQHEFVRDATSRAG